MRYAVSFDSLTETTRIELSANCFLDSMPLVSTITIHNADADLGGPEIALAAAILTRDYCGDVFEVDGLAITPDLAEAIRIILPQTPNVAPINGMHRALWAGTVEVAVSEAGAAFDAARTASSSGLPVMQVDWSGDFVDRETRSGAGHRYGRYVTNAGLVADPVEVSIAIALLHAGPQCRTIRVPVSGRDPARYRPIAEALSVVAIGLELVAPERPAQPVRQPDPNVELSAPEDWNTVWLYWENHYSSSMPAYLELCLETIRRQAGDARVIVVSPENLWRYIAPDSMPARYAALSPNHKSDYLRVRLLHDYGGMWIDIDTVAFESLSRHILSRLDENELVSLAPRFSQQIFASRPHGAFVREALAALEERLAGDGHLGWNGLGSELIYPIAEAHACSFVQMRGWLHHWQDWRKYLEPGQFDHENRLVCSLYNKHLFEPLRNLTRDELLAKDWLVARMLRHALGLPNEAPAASYEEPDVVFA